MSVNEGAFRWLKSQNSSKAADAIRILSYGAKAKLDNSIDTILDWLSIKASESAYALMAYNRIVDVVTK